MLRTRYNNLSTVNNGGSKGASTEDDLEPSKEFVAGGVFVALPYCRSIPAKFYTC